MSRVTYGNSSHGLVPVGRDSIRELIHFGGGMERTKTTKIGKFTVVEWPDRYHRFTIWYNKQVIRFEKSREDMENYISIYGKYVK